MVNKFFFNGNKSPRATLLRKSTKAVCGITEREIVVPTSQVSRTVQELKQSGFVFVGTGPAGRGFTKIWFAGAGGL